MRNEHSIAIQSKKYSMDFTQNCSPTHRKKKSHSKILVVEDNPLMRKMTCALLESTDYHVDVVETGKDAVLRCFEKNYDLIILDIGLPDIDGRDVCKIIRKYQRQHIPIIAYTACESFEKSCFAAGVDEFVVKPLEKDNLLQLLHKWLQLK